MEVNCGAVSQYSSFLKACGVKGILCKFENVNFMKFHCFIWFLVNDQIGEGMSLTLSERRSLTEEWVQQCEKNGQFLMVQIGGVPLKDVIELVSQNQIFITQILFILPLCYRHVIAKCTR